MSTEPPDDTRINVGQEHEVKYWSQKRDVTPQQILDAVKRVGPMVKDVQRALGK